MKMSLVDAVESDNFDAVQDHIIKGGNVNEVNKYGQTLLHLAMEKSETLISILLNLGADVNAMDSFGCTALYVATKKNNHSLVKLLLSHGALVDVRNIDGRVSLHFMAIYSKNDSHLRVCEILLEHNVCVDAEDYRKNTPLFILLQNRAENNKICKLLIDHGAKVNVKSRRRNTPLHEAVKTNKLHMMQLLLSRGAKVNAKNKYGRTPLHEAVYTSNLRACILLLENKANINSRNKVGKTPLHLLSNKNKIKSTKICIFMTEKGANVNAKNKRNRKTVLHLAAVNNRSNLIKLFLSKGARSDAKDKKGRTALHEAVMISENDSHLKVCEELLLGNANVNAETRFGKTPLYLLSKRKAANDKIFELLIKKGADVNVKSMCRRTPLHWAVINNQVKMIELLLAEGAQHDTKDGKNRTPLHEAISRSKNDSHLKVCELLLERIANARNNDDKRTLDVFTKSLLKNPQMTNLLQKLNSPKIDNGRIPLAQPHVYATRLDIFDEEKYPKIGHAPPCDSFQINTLAYDVAMASNDASRWKIAMENEIKVLEKQNTWSLCTLPVGKSTIKCRWIFTVKADKSHQARLTAQKVTQVIDLYGTPYIIRSILSEAAKRDYEMIKFDVKTGMLQGRLKEEVYLEQPPGFVNPDQPTAVYKLNRSFRGLDPSLIRWNTQFLKFMERFKFKCIDSKMKHVFIGEVNKFVAYLVLYHDCGLIVCERTRERNVLLDYLKVNFDIDARLVNNLQVDELFGIEIFRDRENCSIKLSQSSYAKQVLQYFGVLDSAYEEKVPVKSDWHKRKGEKLIEKIEVPIREVVASLMCLSLITRPDMDYAANYVAQFCDKPDSNDWEAVKILLRYLKRTWNYAIVYSRRQIDFDIQVHTAVANCPISKLSRSGYVLTMNGGPVLWCSRQTSNGFDDGNEPFFYDSFYKLKFYTAPIKVYTNSKSKYINRLVQEKKIILGHDEETFKLANIFVQPLHQKDFIDVRYKLNIVPMIKPD